MQKRYLKIPTWKLFSDGYLRIFAAVNKKELTIRNGLLGRQPRLGILGAGQLGKMLAHAAANWDLPLYFLDKSPDFPAAPFAADFFAGDFKNYDDVLAFGRQVDVLTIEIEHVNTDALLQLEKEGKIIHPNPQSLKTIKDKGLQKQFYKKRKYPTSVFELHENKSDILTAIKNGTLSLPFVQKSRGEGYDGKGVVVIKNESDFDQILDTASLTEPLVAIEKELAVIACRNEAGEIKTFPVVDMEFEPKANLVEFLFCPSEVSENIKSQTREIAAALIEDFDICGLLAVEFFLTTSNEILINEVAPRPHNSGHHTINANITSQFEQHLRGVLNLPLGDTNLIQPAVMINLLGAENYQGPVKYEGVKNIMKESGVHLHLYGKKETRPFRKMGHATIVHSDLEKAKDIARKIKGIFKIKS